MNFRRPIKTNLLSVMKALTSFEQLPNPKDALKKCKELYQELQIQHPTKLTNAYALSLGITRDSLHLYNQLNHPEETA
jgi:hypothetical protein